MPRFPFTWCALCATLAIALPGQRPKSAEQAIERLTAVADQNESTRRRPVADLGRFAEPAVTRLLLAELGRATSDSFRQTVVRALGGLARPEPAGVVAALQRVMEGTENPRLCDESARSLAAQGEPGVAVLGRVLSAHDDGMLRTAACRGLERAEGETARDLLLTEIGRAGGRNRIAPLQALAQRAGDPLVDEARVKLAGDKDYRIAAEAVGQLAIHAHPDTARLALQLSRRLSAKAGAEQHAAILHGLLRQRDPKHVDPKHFEAIQHHAARAQAPFGERTRALWTAVLADTGFAGFLQGKGARHDEPAERRVTALALALVPESGRALATQTLTGMLLDADDAVVRAAAMSLSQFGRKLAMPPLFALIANGRDEGKSAAAVAIDAMCHDDAGWHGLLLGHSQDRSPALSATALRLLVRCGDELKPQALDAAAKGLTHKAWQVRAAAIELVAALRLPAAVPLLIDRLDREKARLHEDVAAALESLTALRFPDGKTWRAWWKKEGAGFAIAPPAKAGAPRDRRAETKTGATYWNLPVHSDRIAFVVDSSGSMRAPFGTGSTRLDEAKRQLGAVLGQLPSKARANILAFATDVSAWAETLQPLSSKRRKAGTLFAAGLEARGATDVHGALRLAFADPDVDTIFLLTDGRPSAGEIIDANALAAEVARWNVGRCIRIHCVAIGDTSRLLQRLAKESGGNYTVAR